MHAYKVNVTSDLFAN